MMRNRHAGESRSPIRRRGRAPVRTVAVVTGLLAFQTTLAVAPTAAQTADELCDPGGTEQFSDVSSSDYGARYILCARALGLSQGTGDGTFDPDRNLNRGQMAAFLVRLWRDVLEQDCPAGGEPFTDVGDDHWAAADIACLYNLGIARGVDADTYDPRAGVKVSQTTRFVTRLLNRHADGFCDTAEGELAKAAECLVDRNIAPSETGAKSPQATSRAQMAVFLVGAWHYAAGLGEPPKPPARTTQLAAGTCGGAIDDAPRQLTETPTKDPAWSPDCGYIVYSTDAELWLMRNDGTDQRVLVVYDGGRPTAPAWSPDGARIAYSRQHMDGGRWVRHIYVVNADGTGKTQLTDGDVLDGTPSWSPDGERMAFSRSSGSGRDSDGNRVDSDGYITVMDATGRNHTALTKGGGWDYAPAWSPDGTKIAFLSHGIEHWEEGVVTIMDPDGANVRLVHLGYARDLAWSPDGTRLAFSLREDDGGAIVSTDLNGLQEEIVVDLPVEGASLSWSPDGQLIAFSYRDADYNHHVHVAGAGGRPVIFTADCRPRGSYDTVTAGFPLPDWAAPSTGVVRLAVLFMDFPNAPAAHSTHEEVVDSLPYMEQYLEEMSYSRLDLEFEVLHGWLRAEDDYEQYLEGRWFSVDATAHAATLADDRIDFSAVDGLMVVFPSDQFAIATAGGSVTVDEVKLPAFRMNVQPLPGGREITSNGWAAAHEFLHILGLSDLYPKQPLASAFEHPSGTSLVQMDFGIMGLGAVLQIADSDPRLTGLHRQPSEYRTDYWLFDLEMLGWSRWQIGWLHPDQLRCIDDAVTTVAIEPISGNREGVLLAAIPVSASRVIVLENRRALVRDLFNEGVLVYTVDAPFDQRPLKLAGDGGDGRVQGHPVLGPGQSVRVWGYEIAVMSDDGTTSTVRISRLD